MKKIINNPTDVVSEALMGMQAAYPDKLVYTPKMEVISRKEKKTDKVAVISGGGAGHEPLHAGFVGKGMLDAAISGNVFSSPSPDRIGSAIEQVSCGKGVLMVIKNYSGDIMNFGLSADLAEMDDIEVAQVIVKDDVAVPDREEGTGRRGIAGTVFVHKLAEVKAAAEKAVRNIRTMGVAMTPCILPAVGKPGFQIADDEIEIGMGIHGEQGVETTKIKSAKEIAEILVGRILDDYDYSGRELQIQVLFQADEKNHCHGEHCEEQFVSDSGLAAQNGHGCMKQCKYMYYARGLYLRQVHNSSFKCLCGMPVCPARVTIQS